jgi:hypothetical protein
MKSSKKIDSRKSRIERLEKIWLITPRALVPPGKAMKSIRDYNRKREKNVKPFMKEY